MLNYNFNENPNLTLRDIFALQALTTINFQNYNATYSNTTSEKIISNIAYNIADAMLERRKR